MGRHTHTGGDEGGRRGRGARIHMLEGSRDPHTRTGGVGGSTVHIPEGHIHTGGLEGPGSEGSKGPHTHTGGVEGPACTY
jgi:hypothetical protein